ncbi:protein tweety homolog 2-like [Moschus berezovskii]|uniref:protein tweety homolog 2-like n=1 Tax=Moschus berezovskii TaxID=68408 RepID=UPI0024443B4B|nr:protein tweety homolog 2-like [Moschus berezovskii]
MAHSKRWLSYLLLFILDLVLCLLSCLGLAKRSRCLLASMLCCRVLALLLSWTSLAADAFVAMGTSDFCASPDTFILNITEGQVRPGKDLSCCCQSRLGCSVQARGQPDCAPEKK